MANPYVSHPKFASSPAPPNPLIAALPPATDYLTYLTILDYNLTKDQLPTLHRLLQDTTLTTNIGWDLVHLLLPLLPESRECLEDVARLGNPREVILKVTELVEEIGRDVEGETKAEVEEDSDDGGEDEDDESGEEDSNTVIRYRARLIRARLALSRHVLHFTTLISLLSILHPRIKTKYPSRFLATSLTAILPAYGQMVMRETTLAVLNLIGRLWEGRKPPLPPRGGSVSGLNGDGAERGGEKKAPSAVSAPDPEAGTDGVGEGEGALQVKLLQAFLTHIVELWVESQRIMPREAGKVGEAPEADVGMGWSVRDWERKFPHKIVPGRKTLTERFKLEDRLVERDEMMGRMTALAKQLRLTPEFLQKELTLEKLEKPAPSGDDLPSSSSDVPLSENGSLYLLAALLYNETPSDAPSLKTFPTLLLRPSQVNDRFGWDRPITIPFSQAWHDSVLYIGRRALDSHQYPDQMIPKSQNKADDEETVQLMFLLYLGELTFIAACNPSSDLRYQAHLLIIDIGRWFLNGESQAKFLHSVLENPRADNLCVSGIAWFKAIISPPRRIIKPRRLNAAATAASPDDRTITLELVTGHEPITSISPLVFPHIQEYPEVEHMLADVPFLLASLNFLYLISSTPNYYNDFALVLWQGDGKSVRDRFLAPLLGETRRFLRVLNEAGEDSAGEEKAMLDLMENTVLRAQKALESGRERWEIPGGVL
ncbi:hypothetical protein MMC25_004871 [Agyrium rufum]|nr:hypothetical protein [Agyrium rufum]